MNGYFQNISLELTYLQSLDIFEASVNWLGEHHQALWTLVSSVVMLGVAPAPFNHSKSWEVQHLSLVLLMQIWTEALLTSRANQKLNYKLQMKARSAVLGHLDDLAHWLNPKHWFSGLSLDICTLTAIGMIFLLLLLAVLRPLCVLF